MAWKLIEVPDDDPEALTDNELVGIGIKLRDDVGPDDFRNPFWTAFEKILPQFKIARERWNNQ